jgi:uncharacterized membrane protein YagU involved in acid resistance
MAVQDARGGGSSSVPGEVGKRVIEGVFQRDAPEGIEERLTMPVHVAYGTSWGAVFGVVQRSLRPRRLRHGLLFGTLVWLVSLIQLPAMRLAPPVWRMPAREIPIDLSYHLVYGLGVAAGDALLGD